MKQTLAAAALAVSLLLSGCSGVSQEEYNSLVDTKETSDSTTPSDTANLTEDGKAQETQDSKGNDTNKVNANDALIAHIVLTLTFDSADDMYSSDETSKKK